MIVDTVCRELLRRGYRVMTAHAKAGTLQVTFDFAGGRDPAWLKAVQVPLPTTPDAVEAEVQAWQQKVLADIALGRPSPIVRRMIAEHGHDAVLAALKPVVAA